MLNSVSSQTVSPHDRTRAILSVLLAAAGIAALLLIRQALPALNLPVLHSERRIDLDIKYQFTTFLMACGYILVLRLLYPVNFARFARLGRIDAPASPVKSLGIGESDTWRKVGINFAIIITIVTAIFIYLNVMNGQMPSAAVLGLLPFALIFAASNAFVEETLTRLTVVVGLHGILPSGTIYLISAAVFGIPHYFGTPGGIIGALMAGFMGWLLARSIVETEGVFWAWFIHFLQDIVIFIGIFAALIPA